jgi:acyl-CoA synthetase (AMP-forming)/AMP-acid ligase II
MEPDRYVKIKDRSKDVIISGGENISSIEVEDALYRHPAVLACAVVARPDPSGANAGGLCRAQARRTGHGRRLVAHCKGLLAGYKVPREIRFEPSPRPAPARSRSSSCASGRSPRPPSNEENMTDDRRALVLRTQDERGVVTLTLNRPQAFNSLSEAMLTALQAALDRWPKTAVPAWW